MILDIQGIDGIQFTEDTIAAGRASDKWHTDVTFRENPSMGGILRARVMPALGGDTLFADTVAICSRPAGPYMKERIDTLRAEHDILQSFGGQVSEREARRALRHTRTPPVSHPVVRTHPETGEQALYVNRTFHLAHPGRRRGREPRVAAVSDQQGEVAGIPGPLPLEPQRHRLLGQPSHPTLRRARLPGRTTAVIER